MNIALLAAGALVFGGGLRADFPTDAPILAGVELDLKYFVLPEAWAGLAVAWGGGVDDTNPERLKISQRIEIATTLGARLGYDDDFGFLLGARAGVFRAEGFPNGPFPRVRAWGPLLGAETGLYIGVGRAWGHRVWLEPRVGYSTARIEGEWLHVPWFGLAFTARLDSFEGEVDE